MKLAVWVVWSETTPAPPSMAPLAVFASDIEPLRISAETPTVPALTLPVLATVIVLVTILLCSTSADCVQVVGDARRIVAEFEACRVGEMQIVDVDLGADAGSARRQAFAGRDRDVVGDRVVLDDIRRLIQVVLVDQRRRPVGISERRSIAQVEARLLISARIPVSASVAPVSPMTIWLNTVLYWVNVRRLIEAAGGDQSGVAVEVFRVNGVLQQSEV